MCKLMCSTGVFSRDPDLDDHYGILSVCSEIDVKSFELIFYPSWYENAESIAHDFKRSGFDFPVLHSEKSIGPLLGTGVASDRSTAMERLRTNCDFGRKIGATSLVLHLWGLPGSDELLEHNLSALPDCADICEAFEITLSVETIPCIKRTPLESIRKALEREPRVSLTLDTEFLAMHDELDIAFDEEWLWKDGKVNHIHFKDYDGSPVDAKGKRKYLHPGEGHLDFKKIASDLKSRDYAGTLSLESSAVDSSGLVDLARARKSLDAINRIFQDVS